MSKPSSSDIAQHAYHIWEREGRPHGRDQEHWFMAEREILGAGTAAEDRPIGEIRYAQQASSRQIVAAASGRMPQVQEPRSAPRMMQSQAGQPSEPQSPQSASNKAEPSGRAKPRTAAKRKPRAGGKQPNS